MFPSLSVAWLLLVATGFAVFVNGFYPLREWLFPFWARAWLGALAFGAASFAAGLQGLSLLRVRPVPLVERYTLALSLGVLAFALGVFVCGELGMLGRAFFFAWPGVLFFAGGRALLHEVRRVRRHLGRLGSRLVLPQRPSQALAMLLALGGLVLLYLRVVTPTAIGFDARWYHLPIAENYATAGRIRPFPEGWYLGAYPHLASLLYTWALLAPGELSHRLCLAVHLEFVLFLGMLAGVSALAARLVAGGKLRHGGAALFLFPCVFLPYANLNGGADDVLAYWTAPLGLALFRYLAAASYGNAVLLGALVAAACLTKYQAIYAVVALTLVLLVDLVRRRRLAPLAVAASVALVVSSPHWLTNWLFYGDPLYPNLNRWLPDHPFFHGARAWLERYYWFNGAPRTAAQKLHEAWRGILGFSFFPHGWGGTPLERPVFGSLFTLLLPLLFWVRPRWRVLLLAACVHVGLAVWYVTYMDDRFLQALVPWMAACTAAGLSALWRTGRPDVRVATLLLVGLDLVWGADVPFLHTGSLRSLLDHVAAGDEKHFARTAYPGAELQAIGERLHDPDARLVGHDFYQSLGVGAQTICDNPAWQGSIDYLALDTPARTLHRWRRLGATHALWPLQKEDRPPDDLARDAVFARTVTAFAGRDFTVAGFRVAKLARRRSVADSKEPTRILWLGCGDRALGIYTPEGLSLGTVDRSLTSAELRDAPAKVLARVNAVWSRSSCADSAAAQAALSPGFREVLRAGDAVLSIRIRH